MKVAIAGTGNVAQYLIQEFLAYGHDVVVLTRSKKSSIKVVQRETDYTVTSLVSVLEDRDALVSTVSDYENPANELKAHLDMLEAVEQSEQCKKFIPSQWTSNVEDYPEQPMFAAETAKKLRDALESQDKVQWTIVCNAWFADYVVPARLRYLPDVGPFWPMDHETKTFTIYGPGTQIVNFTSVRDVAKAVAALLATDQPWEKYTYISGQQLTWNELFQIVKSRDAAWTSRTKPLANNINDIARHESPMSVLAAMFEIISYSGALHLPAERVQRQREKYFPTIHFRTVEEILDAAIANPDVVI